MWNRFEFLENMHDNVGINMAWWNITKNIETSDNEGLD